MDKIARVRREIERRIKIYHESNHGFSLRCDECEELLTFLDTLSEEPDKNLEEAVEEAYPIQLGQETIVGDLNKLSRVGFIAGWKCRDDQMPMPEDTVLFQKGVAEGRRLEGEDMMKDAVEGEVVVPIYEGDDTWSAEIRIPGRYEIGDKVRIVVLKADD